MPYSSSPDSMARATSRSIDSESSAAESIRASETAGSAPTSTGQSHSWLRPTSDCRNPSAQTISVAEGSSETMRTASP